MASKVELRGTIARLDETALVDGLNHAELTTLLAELKDAAADVKEPDVKEPDVKEPDADAEEDARLDAEVDAAKDKVADDVAAEDRSEKVAYAVVDGKSLTTKRGILSDGDLIKATDLAGGQEALDAFLKSGHVEKV